MKIHVLMENTACSPEYSGEHGLSLLIESEGRRILFDAGASPAFADNARRMGVDLSRVDFAVLSHGHYDHGGGLSRFLELNTFAPVWVSPFAFETHLNAAGKDIGIDPGFRGHAQIRFVPDSVYSPCSGVTVFSSAVLPVPHGIDTAGMSVLSEVGRVPEDFRHEQYLLLDEQGKSVLFSGCSHCGILNIADYFCPNVLVGGFHFMKWDVEQQASALEYAAETLSALPTIYYTGHCTGEIPFRFLKERMGERLRSFSSGMCLTI